MEESGKESLKSKRRREEGNVEREDPSQQQQRKQRDFDFSRYPKRKIALMLLYFGWEHEGFAAQPHTENTVEERVLAALMKTRLIESRESCALTKCGRTDKGVSGFRQVIAVDVRSTDVSGEGVYWPNHELGEEQKDVRPSSTAHQQSSSASDQVLTTITAASTSDGAKKEQIVERITTTVEMNYTRMVNSQLPSTIRVVGWCPVGREFSARHNCQQRSYVYILPRGNVNMQRMRLGAQRLVGEHDFRNFCFLNKSRLETSYVRQLNSVEVEPLPIVGDGGVDSLEKERQNGEKKNVHDDTTTNPYALLQLTIKASGFLWHQVRCIVSVLYLIGINKEEPEVVDYLLDVEKCPARPSYGMANPLPLCLFDCDYPEEAGLRKWVVDGGELTQIRNALQRQWAECQVRAALIKVMLGGLEDVAGLASSEDEGEATSEVNQIRHAEKDNESDAVKGLRDFTLDQEVLPSRMNKYIALEKRNKCKSVAERVAAAVRSESVGSTKDDGPLLPNKMRRVEPYREDKNTGGK